MTTEKTMADFKIRKIKTDEFKLLEQFLYEAIYIPAGAAKPPKDIIERAELQVYISGFGTLPDDHCLVAESDKTVVGACWVRIMNDYGHIDNNTPSLAISVLEEYRGRGIGTELITKILDLLRQKHYGQVSLSVQKDNYAAKMYLKVGFRTIKEIENEYIMACKL